MFLFYVFFFNWNMDSYLNGRNKQKKIQIEEKLKIKHVSMNFYLESWNYLNSVYRKLSMSKMNLGNNTYNSNFK